ncbi:PREDICTED: uncharacterized protein LOC101293323 [Fragaria vesca subsp. vesca]|uniref:uncharacterized protein LOC101293323 n=1 Tax=Fragaria vesca subsp. vesca TaxID=101020 RepID=UPI0002C33B1A|nr:PREDICTED: uncharacterized protein LOC101293323 [Fragaria vesca subsp. vesca]
MAVTCSLPPCFSIQKSGPAIKPFSTVLRLKRTSQVTVLKKRTSTLFKIRSSLGEEVFEDHFNGIICYKDARGEIICEGYDEGPRYHHQNQRIVNQSRDAEIFDLLQQNWYNFMTDTELNKAGKGHYLHKGINCNGFNTLH